MPYHRLLACLRPVLAVSSLLALAPAPGRAGVAVSAPPSPTPSGESRWSLNLETAYLFAPVPNPFGIGGRYNANPLRYRLATQTVSVYYRLTETAGPGWLRGNLSISTGLLESTILHGPESFYAGYTLGLRYTFVPRNFPVQPYVDVRGGLGWTDSRGFRHAQQQDFTFTYQLTAGLRYELGPRWSVTLSALDQHISNAYLTHPNYGFDTVGVQLGVGRRF